MRTILLGLLAAAGIAIATPVVPASAQVIVDTPIGGVTVGHRHRYYGDAICDMGPHGIAAVQLDPSTPFRGRQIPAVISV
jgi:hypothetical protein